MLAKTLDEVRQLQEDPTPEVEANLATRMMFDHALEGSDGHAPGLILTAEQIVNFRKYELAALALPGDLPSVIAYLGYERDLQAGLEPEDFLELFKSVRLHAAAWNPLVREVKDTAGRLELFSGRMKIWSDSFHAEINKVQVTNALEPGKPAKLGDLLQLNPEMPADKFPMMDLDAESTDVAKTEFAAIFAEMQKAVAKEHAQTKAIEVRLVTYGNVMNNDIQPQISLKRQLISNRMESEKARQIQDRVDERALRIKEADEAYHAGVTEAVKGAVGGNVLMSIYVGVRADEHRRKRNGLMEEQDADLVVLAAEKTIQSAMYVILSRFQLLEIVVSDASKCTENLITVWKSISGFTESSSVTAQEIDNAQTLVTFARHIRSVCDPWIDIKAKCQRLLNVFDQADRKIDALKQR